MSQEVGSNESSIDILELYSETIELKGRIENLEKQGDKLDIILDRITEIQGLLTERLVAVEVKTDNMEQNHVTLSDDVKHISRNGKLQSTAIGGILVALVTAAIKVVFKA